MNKLESQMSSCSSKDAELFKDNLNISDFFNEQFNALNGSAAPLASTSSASGHGISGVVKQGSDNNDHNNMIMNNRISVGAAGHVPLTNGQNNINVLNGASQRPMQPPPQNSYRAQEQRVPSYDQNVRLPDSPPETDSGAASAGSPSGSDTPPFSPEYQQYHSNSVIRPTVATSHDQETGVLLNVHGLDNLTHTIVSDYIMPLHNNNVNNGHLQGQQQQQQHTSNYYPNESASSNGQQQQISPGTNYNPYILPPPLQGSNTALSDTMSRKRQRVDSTSQYIKPEPSSPPLGLIGDDLLYEDGLYHQSIRFFEFQKEQWHSLCDITGRELLPMGFHVVADKGFNFSHFDGSFVNQKKNHFQISAHIEIRDRLPPKFVRTPGENGVLRPILEFQLDFYGVKTEMLSSTVQIKQSQTDRKPIAYEPVKLDLPPSRVTKVTVARLHFSETTMNNQRKNNRPNPDQKYLYLVVALNAVVSNTERYTVVAYNSEKVIVRASNPGQFDTGENEAHWQRGQNANSIYHPGPVGIGTDKPASALTVAGDIQCTGTVYHPSDARLKQNIKEVNCAEALSNLSQIRIVRYEIRPEIADQWGMPEKERHKMGVIAQEVEQIVPDAVKENGEYLTVDDSRLFYESAAAVKELCRLTGNLEYKIEEVEKISKKFAKLNKLKRFDSFRSSVSSNCSASKVANMCASYLSCSRTSLPDSVGQNNKPKEPISATTTPQLNKRNEQYKRRAKDDQHHHHYHHHFCRRLGGEQGLCKNKVIQMTIILLVLVMAFCLVAMATLYVLDWHKRNSSGESTTTQQSPTFISLPVPTPKPPPQQLIITKPPALVHPTKPPQRVFPVPIIHPCLKPPCETYCCQNPSLLYNIEPRPNDSNNDTGQQIYISTQNNPPPIGQSSLKKSSYDPSVHGLQPEQALQFDYVVDELVSDVIDGLMTDDAQVQRKKRSNTNHNNNINRTRSITHKATSTLVRKTQLRNSSSSPNSQSNNSSSSNVAIRILGLNVSIDEKYLVNDFKGNYTYYIPISSHMPYIPLEVEFGVDTKEQVQYCWKDTPNICPGLENAYNTDSIQQFARLDIHQSQANVYELPVGSYQHSLFTFRIGASTTLCSLPIDEVGATFEEYNLLFYRVCKSQF